MFIFFDPIISHLEISSKEIIRDMTKDLWVMMCSTTDKNTTVENYECLKINNV